MLFCLILVSGKMFVVTLFIFALSLSTPLLNQPTHVEGLSTHHETILRLFQLTSNQQAKENTAYIFMKQWFVEKGVYKSSIKLNLHGRPDVAEGRRLMDIYDNNMFATAWVTSSLLESFRYNNDISPSIQQILVALDVINSHRNMNSVDKTSTFSFWQQRYNNTVKYWSSAPYNLLSCFDAFNKVPLSVVEEILNALGFSADAKLLEDIREMEGDLLAAFHIPPDFDDTFVNLGVGAILSEMKTTYNAAWKAWASYNTNITSALSALKKYAYRPFSSDYNVNAIDPRTYYYIRNFLDQAAASGKDVALVPTWIQNVDEIRTQYYRGVAMPFSVNNVDLTVSANTIYGITSAILNGILSPDVLNDKELTQIYLNTTSLISHMLNTNLTDRPDLALTYYPSRMEFNWFVSRTTSLLESYKLAHSQLPNTVLKEAYATLIPALKGKMTAYILSQAKKDSNGHIYFDDFLGDADLTFENKTLIRAEDRIFTTSMAANALLYTWTIFDQQQKQSSWKPDTPTQVKSVVKGCIAWLEENILSGDYDPWNAFFSGSVKGPSTIPFFYPLNLMEHLNGTKTDWKHYELGDRLAMSGYVTKSVYEAMLKARESSPNPTPLVFHGYNGDSEWFPFWSSDAYTYVTAMVALSRFDNIVQ